MPFIMLGVLLIHGSQGRSSLPFSLSSVIGNLVTVLNFKFWHSCGAAIRLLARHTARGFSRNPLIVLNTNNIYIHWDEAKFTAGFLGWLQDSLILNFRGLPCLPPRVLSGRAAARGTLASIPGVCPPANSHLSLPLPITPLFLFPQSLWYMFVHSCIMWCRRFVILICDPFKRNCSIFKE